ncbi:MAG TPA: lysophospholipid acyltransferase family protein [Nitrospirota bacterium]|nr:lysophospholipid acyltransferase family protein [Nitrospirota bacterium]
MSYIGWVVLYLWSRTVRIRKVNQEIPRALHDAGKNFIYAFWHGRQFLLFHSHRNTGIVIPASESRDGEIQAQILKRFGFDVVRGSSKRKGERALLALVDGLRKGKTIALAVDGPRGPLHEVKQGVTYLAGKLNKPIVPVVTGARRHWILGKIWDRYMLPKPFTAGVVIYGNPIVVNGTANDELESKRRELEASLNSLMIKADGYFNTSEFGITLHPHKHS